MKKLYVNGTVITMDDQPVCDSLLEEEGIILAVGNRDELQNAAKHDCEIIDLHGRTVLPAFIDAHGHLSSYASSFLQASLAHADSFQAMMDTLTAFCSEHGLSDGQWLIASGYDHNRMAERMHPTKAMLDQAFPKINVVLQHQSGHFGVMNSAALSALSLIGQDTDGYLEEKAWVEAIKDIPLPSVQQLLKTYQTAFWHYAGYGITTVQEGMMVRQMVPMIRLLLDRDAFALDVVAYPDIHDADFIYCTFPKAADQYDRHFRLGGYKIILDGSPQGRTAWMRTPYRGNTNEFGVSSLSDEEVEQALRKAIRDGRQLLAHCNGDRAIAQLLNAAKNIGDAQAVRKIKPVIVHAQFLSTDQLDDVKTYGFIPSFFVAHTYYWGDIHIENLGPERAQAMSMARSAQKKGILFTFHQDAPVIEPNMFETVWCATVRKTKNGAVLGPNEQISVKDALKAVTVHAAAQYGEEHVKGTLSKGKQANFIVVDQNPLTCSSDELRKIQVLQTYQAGVCIFDREA